MGGQKKYLITSAQACASPHKNFLSGLEKYADEHGSEIIILPMIGMNAHEGIYEKTDKHGDSYGGLDKSLEKYCIEFGKRKLNNNLYIEQFDVQPQNIDPLTSQLDFAYTSVIFASPKQRLKAISDSNFKMPRIVQTTGACTLPRYANRENCEDAERWRRGSIAKKQHVIGGLIVEIENEEIFHLRNIRADSEGKFVDFGLKYDGNKKTKSILEAIVFGDWHVGYTDPLVRKASYEMIKELKPKRIILHDFFDGHSVSPHKDDRLITEQLIEGVDKGFDSLEEELKACRNELLNFNEAMKGREIYVVASNHNEFLDRYLDSGRLFKDAKNRRISLELSIILSNDKNPVEGGIRMIGKIPDNIKFLRRDEDLKVRGYQLAAHGDKGPSGGRGSINTKRRQFRRSISGHVHSAEIKGDTYIDGTSTPLNLFYTKGSPTDWTNTHALLWDNGTVQMINVIFGKWKIK